MTAAVIVAFACGILAVPLFRLGGAIYGRLVRRRRIALLQAEYAAAQRKLSEEMARPAVDFIERFAAGERAKMAGDR